MTRARSLIIGGSHDEGIEELRQALIDATRLSPHEGRAKAEQVLRFANEMGILEEIDDLMEQENLIGHFFGTDWK